METVSYRAMKYGSITGKAKLAACLASLVLLSMVHELVSNNKG